jgi:hypothetical protein
MERTFWTLSVLILTLAILAESVVAETAAEKQKRECKGNCSLSRIECVAGCNRSSGDPGRRNACIQNCERATPICERRC